MESFSFAFNAVAPIVAMVAIGYFLKKAGIIGKEFAKNGNRLVFKIFLPVMLFSNVYKIENLGEVGLGHVLYALPAIFAVFLLAFFSSGTITKEGPKRSALIQGMFRSNYALIGIPLAGSLFGDEGISAAAVLSAFAIPLFNILAVAEFAFFSGDGKKPDLRKTLTDIIKNPLIIAYIKDKNGNIIKVNNINELKKYRNNLLKPIRKFILYGLSIAVGVVLGELIISLLKTYLG